MPNTYFQFKQFRIEQEHCAMKVCTDACIQGAYTASWLRQETVQGKRRGIRILDIGTGTGLLALMLAQEITDASIDAIEMDEAAYLQARKNFENSPWSAVLRIFKGDIRTFHLPHQYDFILCNPPFYENDLKSGDARKNQAKHSATLGYVELIKALRDNLLKEGSFCVMLPPPQFDLFRQVAVEDGFYPVRMLKVRHTPAHEIFRMVGYFTRKEEALRTDELPIKEQLEYTLSFKSLMKKYYLYL